MSAVSEIDALADQHAAGVSVWVGGIDGSCWLGREPDRVHPAASTFKAALLVALHRAAERGELSLDEEVEIHSTLPSAIAGATYETTQDYDNDHLPWQRLGRSSSLRWLGERAIVRSSNLATNLLLDRLGLDAVDRVYADADAPECHIGRGIQDGPAAEAGRENVVTARGLAAVVAGVARAELVGPETAGEVERVLARCEDNAMAVAGLPPGTYIAHKPGWFEGACHDHGLVRPAGEEPFVFAVLTAAELDEDAAARLVAEVSAIFWAHRHELSGSAACGGPQ